jgi:DNA-binding CsgD family transcriptional regulator/tetratricopeptide (TPR) repeat protein
MDSKFGSVWPMVGRDAELRALTEAIDDVDCGGVALIGAAGFGKTRLAAQALAAAEARGMAVVTVRATRSSSGVPLAALAPFLNELGLPAELDATLLLAAAEAIDARRGNQRMVLFIDDAHELDDASAILLDRLVEHGGACIIFTARAGEGDPAALVRKWRDQLFLRIEVGALPNRDLRTLAEGAIGGPVDGASLQAIVESSGGNVLFLRELIHGALESRVLTSELGLWSLRGSLAHSPRLRDLIEERLTGLSKTEREALELVALGDPVPLKLLEHLVPLEAIEQLEGRGLLDVLEGNAGPELRLNHPLYGDVVRTQLPSLRRIRLSRSLADAADIDGTVEGSDALRVAVWRLDGGGGGRVEITQAAARTALRMEDYSLAVRLSRSAWDQSPTVDAAIVLGEALDFLGQYREADEVLLAAAPMVTNDWQRTKLTVRRAAILFRSVGDAGRSEAVIEEAMSLVTDPACRRELQALRGNHLLMAGEIAKSIAQGQELLLVPGDAAFAQASLDVGVGLAFAGRTTEAIDHVDAAFAARVDLADEEQLSAVGIYLVAQSLAHMHAGNLAVAAGIGDAGYRVSVEKSNPDGQAWFAAILGLVYLNQGRPASAANMFRESATLFGALNHPGRRDGLGGIALASAFLGQLDVSELALAELDDTAPTAVHLQEVTIMRGRAWTAMLRGEMTAARDLLWEALALAEETGQHATAAETLHDLVRMGAGDGAAEQLEEMGQRVDGAFMEARIMFAQATRHGDMDRAATAADLFEAIGANLFAAEAASLEAAQAEAAGLRRRATDAEARSARLLEQCEGASTPGHLPQREMAQLTDREHEVARLAAQGLTSREIAEGLFVSVRTVDNHLQQVYVKLGIKRRSELADRLSYVAGVPKAG